MDFLRYNSNILYHLTVHSCRKILNKINRKSKVFPGKPFVKTCQEFMYAVIHFSMNLISIASLIHEFSLRKMFSISELNFFSVFVTSFLTNLD